MVISSDKPLKICPFPECRKEVRNLGFHIANQHPHAFAKMDSSQDSAKQVAPLSMINSPVIAEPVKSVQQILSEKLDTMLNIKIIQMLEHGASLEQIQQSIRPSSSNITLEDIKKYHDLFYTGKQAVENEDNTGKWIDLATTALPIIREMLPGKKAELEQDGKREPNTNEGRAYEVPRLVQNEVTEYRKESADSRNESADTAKPDTAVNNSSNAAST